MLGVSCLRRSQQLTYSHPDRVPRLFAIGVGSGGQIQLQAYLSAGLHHFVVEYFYESLEDSNPPILVRKQPLDMRAMPGSACPLTPSAASTPLKESPCHSASLRGSMALGSASLCAHQSVAIHMQGLAVKGPSDASSVMMLYS